jgi:hypothetical protein
VVGDASTISAHRSLRLSTSATISPEAPTPGYGSGDVTQMIAAMGNIELPVAAGLYVLAGGGILSLSVPDASTSEDQTASQFTFDAGA